VGFVAASVYARACGVGFHLRVVSGGSARWSISHLDVEG
jgi:hypothetical protein